MSTLSPIGKDRIGDTTGFSRVVHQFQPSPTGKGSHRRHHRLQPRGVLKFSLAQPDNIKADTTGFSRVVHQFQPNLRL
ncbi:MAG TPA: hypothetical protein VLB68_12045 [Pyrinomonadaceae bacterium]|nr:hypothetical protein [Pyrinomonadaceae bacterium]